MRLLWLVALSGCVMSLDLGEDGLARTSPRDLYIVAGGDHTCFMSKSYGACWGRAGRGQTGPIAEAMSCPDGPCFDFPKSLVFQGALALTLGAEHRCELTSERVLECVGGNVFGQLGRGSADDDSHETPVALDLDDVRLLASGRFHTCAATASELYCFGLGHQGQLGVDPEQLDTCVVPAAYQDEIGSDVAPCAKEPVRVLGLDDVVRLTAGASHTCAIDGTGTLLCFGAGEEGQLGDGAKQDSWVPTSIDFAAPVDVAAGGAHTCVVASNGRLSCFGAALYGQLGLGASVMETCVSGPCRTTPTLVGDLRDVVQVVAGDASTCARLADGEVRCFGSDAFGQLGNSSAATDTCATPLGDVPCSTLPTPPHELTDVVLLTAGATHVCALRGDDEVRCFGNHTNGQCGLGLLLEGPIVPFPAKVYVHSP